ncbi:S-adenosyl-L-methionine-dependent methyltransferase [Hypoxylon fragiforme]|uniref:S-adenosyl-L-methionine-dependent methyltransferase n=1 Tax=Hypoxylon fragiforme TaxID=63214 RepID=UPI0020C64B50|nr:S-adenosyl-L-methionine-dependent methyltransferase [Hypoxylon fragiforme]KAI2609047.1 S-adenosyl-L-methionine-dependent methyltransferase [Hypoxylon fragiforme]
MPANFEKQSYWHDRFQSETSFEWLASSESFMCLVEPYLYALSHEEHPPRILQLGSGTSDLQNSFRSRGYLDVTNIDYEPLALERGRLLEKNAFGDIKMKYVVADVTQLSDGLPANQRFELIVDKSTVDAVSCGGEAALLRMASSVKKSLADGGVWISLSYSSIRFELEGLPFDVEIIAKMPTPKLKINDPDIYHWCYLLRPKP